MKRGRMKIKHNLTKAERKALDDFVNKRNEDITIVKADKGNAVVVFDKSEYVRKVKIPFTGDDYREVKDKTRAQVISQRKKAMAKMRREIGIDGRKKEYRYLINSSCSFRIHARNVNTAFSSPITCNRTARAS